MAGQPSFAPTVKGTMPLALKAATAASSSSLVVGMATPLASNISLLQYSVPTHWMNVRP